MGSHCRLMKSPQSSGEYAAMLASVIFENQALAALSIRTPIVLITQPTFANCYSQARLTSVGLALASRPQACRSMAAGGVAIGSSRRAIGPVCPPVPIAVATATFLFNELRKLAWLIGAKIAVV